MRQNPAWLLVLRFSFVLLAAFAWCAGASAQASEACVASYESAQLYRLRGRYVEAHQALLVCAQTGCPGFIRSDCTHWLPEVEASLPSVVFAITDAAGYDVPHARVFANGKALEGHTPGRASALDPGSYKLRFEAPGFAAAEQAITIREAEKNRIVRVRMIRSRPGSTYAAQGGEGSASTLSVEQGGVAGRVPLATWVLGGASLAGLATFAGFGIAGKRNHEKLEDECAPDCSEQSTKKGRTQYIVADVGLGVSVASAAAALWVYLADRAKGRRETGVMSLHVDGEQAQIGWQQSF